jgi:hypothetical protein
VSKIMQKVKLYKVERVNSAVFYLVDKTLYAGIKEFYNDDIIWLDDGNELVLWNSYYVTVGDFTLANIKIWCDFKTSTYYIISEMDIELIEVD